MTHRFPLNLYLGTLVADLGCFPFDDGTYLSPSDSIAPNIRHSQFVKFR